ncbi:MAG: fumarylacetoacetate hydrolase family protein [Lautropia sp.]|nr:fumarylacetoacetate hydrolase family protein [Lautropia sp.]
MKLATRKDDTRDGQLTVVSRDLKHAVIAEQITGSLQRALDDWRFIAPQLQDLYDRLNQGKAPNAFDFDPREYLAPLPRAFQRVQAHAWPAAERRLRQAQMAPAGGDDTLLHLQVAPSHTFMPGHAPVSLRFPVGLEEDGDEDGDSPPPPPSPARPAPADPMLGGLDFSAQLIAICDDLPVDLDEDSAERHILLLGLANAWHIHAAPPFARQHARDRGMAVAPVLLTPDELGEDWREGRIHRPLHCRLNGRSTGRIQAGNDMRFDFRKLVTALAQQTPVGAGCVLASGPIANDDPDSGWSSLLEARARRQLEGSDQPGPAFMQPGDRIRIDMADAKGHSLFGSIDQVVVA